jgi:hypothetical protein
MPGAVARGTRAFGALSKLRSDIGRSADAVISPKAGRMRPETLLGVLFLVVRLAIVAGVIYFAVAEILRERSRK